MPCINCLNALKKGGPTKRILLKGVFIPELLNNQLASCCFINSKFEFLLSKTEHFHKNIILLFFVQLLKFYFLYFF